VGSGGLQPVSQPCRGEGGDVIMALVEWHQLSQWAATTRRAPRICAASAAWVPSMVTRAPSKIGGPGGAGEQHGGVYWADAVGDVADEVQ
jgi:hypothetical protein